MSIKELEQVRELWFNLNKPNNTLEESAQANLMDYFMKTVIDTLKEFERKQEEIRKQSDDNYRVIQYHTDYMISNYRKINKLTVKFKKLEELNEPEENIKVGGTD